MRRLIGVVWALSAGLAIAIVGTATYASDTLLDAPVVKAAFGCKITNGELICGKKNKNTGAQDGGGQGERSCRPGYVVLKEKNKYGAFCEPKEGLPAPAPAVVEECKFGMIGTPPNDCDCPPGTDFQGYKGCVKAPNVCCTASFPGGGVEGCTYYSNGYRTEAQLRQDLQKAVPDNVASSTSCVPAN